MKFALVAQGGTDSTRFRINPMEGDATSFLNWVDVFQGWYFTFEALKKRDYKEILSGFDVVMFSGNPHNLQDIILMAGALKDTRTITMFYPEGSTQLYDNSINGFDPVIYEAWNSCDILSSAEEDKVEYYDSFLKEGRIARFIHVPMRQEMEAGVFFRSFEDKKKFAVVYGDNNPNHPMIAISVAASLGLDVLAVDCDRGKGKKIQDMFPNIKINFIDKLPTYMFLDAMGVCLVAFYPTEWIGTARYQISCAVTGTPCIGNHDSHTQRRLYPPWMGCDIYNVSAMKRAFKRLTEDSITYDEIARDAFRRASFYGIEETKKRFFDAVNDARRIKFVPSESVK